MVPVLVQCGLIGSELCREGKPPTDIRESQAVLERGTLESVYYLVGEQDYWGLRWVQGVRARIVGRQDGFLRVDEGAVVFADIAAFLQTPGLFGEGRVVLVRDSATWKTKEADVKSWLSHEPLAGTCLILWDKKASPNLAKLLGSHRVIDLVPIKGVGFTRFVESSAKSRRVKLGRGGAEYLTQVLESNEFQIEHELDKLSLYDKDRTWTPRDLAEVVLPLSGTAFWQLSEAVVRRQRDQSLTALNELLAAGHDPLPLLVTIARQLIQLIHALEAQNQGISASAFAQQEGIRDFVATRMYQAAKLWTLHDLNQGLDWIARIDLAMKSGRGDHDNWLTALVGLMLPSA